MGKVIDSDKPILLNRDTCCVCNSVLFKDVFSIKYSEENISEYLWKFYSRQGYIDLELLKNDFFDIKKCINCGMIFQKNIPDGIISDLLYNNWIDPQLSFERNQIWKERIIEDRKLELRDLLRYIPHKQNQFNVLDFGYGWANWSEAALSLGCNVFGCEISPSRIKNADMLGIHNIELNHIKDHKFDIINIDQVLEHLSEPRKVLELLWRSLTNDGLLIIDVPNGSDAEKKLNEKAWIQSPELKEQFNYIAPLEHINCFSRETLYYLTKACGFKQIEIKWSDYKSNVSGYRTLKNQIIRIFLPKRTPLRNIYKRAIDI